jgi:hypothetical protein
MGEKNQQYIDNQVKKKPFEIQKGYLQIVTDA